ncbi:MAG: DUF418 domain-containing protein [Pseudohongiellaceae bacterium]
MTSMTAPVTGRARIQSLDTLRGVALFGILLMNIIAFANPFAAYLDPRVDGATQGLDLAVFMTTDILVEGSMRAIFSMLFGAGMLIFLAKPQADPVDLKRLYYRRTLLLIAFGLFNAYVLVWPGDILFTYGVAGLALYFFRNLPARSLALISLIIFCLLTALHSGFHLQARSLGAEVAAIETLPPGTELSVEQQDTLRAWDSFLEQQFMAPEQIAADLETKRSGYLDNFIAVAQTNLVIQTIGLVANTFWDALAMMLLGMALMKWGVLDGSAPLRTYTLMMLLGFGIGIPVNTWETLIFIGSGFELHWAIFNRPTYDLGRLSLALGYIGLIMALCRAGVLSVLRGALARVGQMALTNYLAQSVLCNLIFLGFGLGLAGALSRFEIYYVVLGVWVLQWLFSVWWLGRYRFGPAEWLWRSLTYRRRQPLRLP